MITFSLYIHWGEVTSKDTDFKQPTHKSKNKVYLKKKEKQESQVGLVAMKENQLQPYYREEKKYC